MDDLTEEDDDFSSDKIQRDQYIEQLLAQNFHTLILDEAHHLRTSWWKSLTYFKEQLTSSTTVALTATPPYDVTPSEWEKYIELCGPIDAEIEIAALVKAGDLCPHQDYVWFSTLDPKEEQDILQFRNETHEFVSELLINDTFIQSIEKHPWLIADQSIDEKVAQYEYYISMLIFLKKVGSAKWEDAFQQSNTANLKLPTFTYEWLEIFLTGLLYNDQYIDRSEEPFLSIRKRLSHIGALERKNVRLLATDTMKKTFVQSTSKLSSICDIVSYEQQHLQNELRLVILADFIYKDDLYKQAVNTRVGVVPIFNQLRTHLKTRCRLGVLTGSLIIVPTNTIAFLQEEEFVFKAKPLKDDATYSEIQVQGASNEKVVAILTKLFSTGGIDTLIGTTALLGEGWDAPSVNRLILASYVGSFMLTNQMRGRAIRTDSKNPMKTAHIWHLVCVDHGMLLPGNDFEALARKFESLSGLDAELPIIVSGIKRLRLPDSPFKKSDILTINQKMMARANEPEVLRTRWLEATQLGEKKREQLDVQKESLPKPFYFNNTLKALLIVVLTTVIVAIVESISNPQLADMDVGFVFFFGILIGLIASIPTLWKIGKIFIQNSSIESRMHTIARIVYEVLFEMGKLETAPQFNKIEVIQLEDGTMTCFLERGQMWEQKLFFQALQQFVDPIENPKYLLWRKSGKRFFVRHDYHAIPDIIGQKKEHVERFVEKWQQRISPAELIYTRTYEGREQLLHARMRAMSSKFVEKSERKSVWR